MFEELRWDVFRLASGMLFFVDENVMFIDHRMPEDGIAADSKSKANFREAELCVEIVKYFLLQGYRTDQIVVLTPYLDQSRERLGACFRRQMLVKPSITNRKDPKQ